jgi:C4-dicarboxylate-specific signal transduction histidine kinase
MELILLAISLVFIIYLLYVINNKNKNLKNIQNSLSNFEILSDSLSVPYYAKDKNGLYIECNKAFLNILKRSKKDVINTTNEEQESLYQLHFEIDNELAEKKSIKYKEVFALKSQKPRVYEFYKSAIISNGVYDGYVCILIDVTEHEKHENQLQWNAHQESEKNKEMVRQHEQERLESVKFTAIGQLAAGITHEINTPLTYIKGNLEMVRMDLDTLPNDYKAKKQILQDVDDMQGGIERIATIVDSMREISQQKKGELKVTNVYSTLITALVMAHNRSKQICKININNEEFSLDSSKDELEFYAYIQDQRIEQVWIIILNNALDELQKKDNYEDRKLNVNIFKKDSKIIIRFHDNAGGIPEYIVEDLFEPFISSKPEGGMGVGLSIAKNILDELDASIRAYNEDGGAVFEVVLTES